MEHCIAWQDVERTPAFARAEHCYVQALGGNGLRRDDTTELAGAA